MVSIYINNTFHFILSIHIFVFMVVLFPVIFIISAVCQTTDELEKKGNLSFYMVKDSLKYVKMYANLLKGKL